MQYPSWAAHLAPPPIQAPPPLHCAGVSRRRPRRRLRAAEAYEYSKILVFWTSASIIPLATTQLEVRPPTLTGAEQAGALYEVAAVISVLRQLPLSSVPAPSLSTSPVPRSPPLTLTS